MRFILRPRCSGILVLCGLAVASLSSCRSGGETPATIDAPVIFDGPSSFLQWTEDGQDLVFATATAQQFGPAAKGGAIRVYDTRTHDTRVLEEAPRGYSGLAVTGEAAIFLEMMDSGSIAIRQVPLAGGAVETLATDLDGSLVTFSVTGDGQHVLFSADGQLGTASPGTAPAVVGRGFPFVTSPDGRQVVVAAEDPWFTDQFAILNLDTSATEPLKWATGECNLLKRQWRWTADNLAAFFRGCSDVLRLDPRTGETTNLLESAGININTGDEQWTLGGEFGLSRNERFLYFWKSRCTRSESGIFGSSCVEMQAVLDQVDTMLHSERTVFARTEGGADGVIPGPVASSPDGARVAWGDEVATYATDVR